jgi:hypothetical protein
MKSGMRLIITSVVTLILFVIYLAASYYQALNFANLTEGAYENLDNVVFFAYWFAILFLAIDFFLSVSFFWERRKRKRELEYKPGTGKDMEA